TARVAADFWPGQGATKEHTLHGSMTEEQRRPGQKAAQPFGRKQFGASGCVAHSLQVAADMRLPRALPSAPNLLPRGPSRYFNSLLQFPCNSSSIHGRVRTTRQNTGSILSKRRRSGNRSTCFSVPKTL